MYNYDFSWKINKKTYSNQKVPYLGPATWILSLAPTDRSDEAHDLVLSIYSHVATQNIYLLLCVCSKLFTSEKEGAHRIAC